MSHDVGWKYQDVVATLEAKRIVKSEASHKKKVAVEKIKEQVKKDPKVVKRIAYSSQEGPLYLTCVSKLNKNIV